MDHAALLNLLAYSSQLTVIALAGCALPALLRLDVPGVRFVYWRALTVLCLALPWIQTRHAVDAAVSSNLLGAAPAAGAPSPSRRPPLSPRRRQSTGPC